MKYLISILLLVISISSYSQSQYESGMASAFEVWKKGENVKASSLFERIGGAEKDKWLPYYYAANVAITAAFAEQDEKLLTPMLDRAEGLIEKAKEISPDNSEIVLLRGLLLTVYVASNPMIYGQKYSAEIMEIYGTSMALDPENPRPVYLAAQYDMGAARFFKQDLAPFCEQISKSIEKFDNFKLKGKFYPNWGRDQAIGILESEDCLEAPETKEEVNPDMDVDVKKDKK